MSMTRFPAGFLQGIPAEFDPQSLAAAEEIQAARPPVEPQPPPVSPEEVTRLEGIPSDQSGSRDLTEGMAASDMVMRTAAPYLPNPRAPGMNVMPGYYDHSVFGPDGKELFDDALVNKPGEIAKLAQDSASRQETLGTNRDIFYDNFQREQKGLLATAAEHRVQDEARTHQEIQKLNLATRKYTEDLANRNEFWAQPGSIFAAIGAAMLAWASPGDPGIGMRMLQQHVQADWERRKGLADMHLGELRSNVANYRAIAGDRQRGDQLALAESYHMAGMELQRIAGQMQSEKNRTALLIGAKEMEQQAELKRMLVTQQSVYNKPRVENPAIANEYKAIGQALPGVGPSPIKGTWTPGMPQKPTGTPVGSGSGTAKPQSSYQSFKSVQGAADPNKAGGKGFISDKDAQFLESRVPGATQQLTSERNDVIQSIMAEIGADPRMIDPRMSDEEVSARLMPQQRAKFNEKMAGYRKWLQEDNKEISSAVRPIAERIGAYKEMGKDLAVLDLVSSRLKVNPDELVGTRYKQMFGGGNVRKVKEFLVAGGMPDSEAGQQAARLDRFVSNFNQDSAGIVNQYIKSIAGGTVTEGEDKRRMEYASSDHSIGSFRNFVRGISRDAHSAAKASIGAAKSNVTRTAWLAYIGQETPTVGYSGVEGYNSFENAQVGNTGKREVTRHPHHGTARDPEVQRAAASRLLSPEQRKKVLENADK